MVAVVVVEDGAARSATNAWAFALPRAGHRRARYLNKRSGSCPAGSRRAGDVLAAQLGELAHQLLLGRQVGRGVDHDVQHQVALPATLHVRHAAPWSRKTRPDWVPAG